MEIRASAGRPLPVHVANEFDAHLRCGRLEEGLLRVRCETCHAEKLVAFSRKKRGFRPSCGASGIAEPAALLADEVLPDRPLWKWVLSLPHAVRFLLTRNPAALTRVLGVVYRAIPGHLLRCSGLSRTRGHTAAVTLIQRFVSALNLNIHCHMMFVDGVYLIDEIRQTVFRRVPQPGPRDPQIVADQFVERIGRALKKQSLVERDIENGWLAAEGEGGPIDDLLDYSVTYRD